MGNQNKPEISTENKVQEGNESAPIQKDPKSIPVQEEKSVPSVEEPRPIQPQEETKPTSNLEELKPTSTQKDNKSVPPRDKAINIGKILAATATLVSICIAIVACIAALVVVPEVRKIIGLKEDPNKIEVVMPTESIPPTPTNGPCVDILDVRFVSDTIFTKDSLSELYPAPPKGEYMILATEYTNMQSQPMQFAWEDVFEVAGQNNTSNNDWTYYFPTWNITWGYYDEHFSESLSGENCYATSNPGLWNRCYMVFDIDPAAKNLYLVLYNLFSEDGTPFNNACKSTWKIPEGNR